MLSFYNQFLKGLLLLIISVFVANCSSNKRVYPVSNIKQKTNADTESFGEVGTDSVPKVAIKEEISRASSFMAQKQYSKAIPHYRKALGAMKPGSRKFDGVSYNLGVAYEKIGFLKDASTQFRYLVENAVSKGLRKDASLMLLDVLVRMEEFSAAEPIVDAMFSNFTMDDMDQRIALFYRAVVYFGLGRIPESEIILSEAYRKFARDEMQFDYYAGGVLFYKARVKNWRFSEFKIRVPSKQKEIAAAVKDFGEKIDLFESAHISYLKTIRVGNVYWALASGYKLGEMIESFYNEIVELPAPKGLDRESREIYFEEIAKAIKPVRQKALKIYQSTYRTALRLNVKGEWVTKLQGQIKSLEGLVEN